MGPRIPFLQLETPEPSAGVANQTRNFTILQRFIVSLAPFSAPPRQNFLSGLQKWEHFETGDDVKRCKTVAEACRDDFTTFYRLSGAVFGSPEPKFFPRASKIGTF